MVWGNLHATTVLALYLTPKAPCRLPPLSPPPVLVSSVPFPQLSLPILPL